jgi:hypothetical protein
LGTNYSRNSNSSSTGSIGGVSSSVGSLVHRAAPSLAFEAEDIEFWGSPYSLLEEVDLSEDDLLINGYGTKYTAPPFVRSAPSWLTFSEHNLNKEPHQLLLDWKDFSPPPSSANIDFWETIVSQAKAEGIKRIICCCGAGLGRTGTALASLALASGRANDPEYAIEMIRGNYNRGAVETKGQELYIWKLVLTDRQIASRGFFSSPPQSESPFVRRGISFEDDDDNSAVSSNFITNYIKK